MIISVIIADKVSREAYSKISIYEVQSLWEGKEGGLDRGVAELWTREYRPEKGVWHWMGQLFSGDKSPGIPLAKDYLAKTIITGINIFYFWKKSDPCIILNFKK